jgi:hypothetical protein
VSALAPKPEPNTVPNCLQLAQNVVLRFPELRFREYCDGVALLSEGGWDAFSKTPTASNPVIRFRVELHIEP